MKRRYTFSVTSHSVTSGEHLLVEPFQQPARLDPPCNVGWKQAARGIRGHRTLHRAIGDHARPETTRPPSAMNGRATCRVYDEEVLPPFVRPLLDQLRLDSIFGKRQPDEIANEDTKDDGTGAASPFPCIKQG